MKKQYWYSRSCGFKRTVILFEDNEPITVYSGFNADEFIDQAEKEGYTRGYLKEDVVEALEHYQHLLENRLDVSYEDIKELY